MKYINFWSRGGRTTPPTSSMLAIATRVTSVHGGNGAFYHTHESYNRIVSCDEPIQTLGGLRGAFKDGLQRTTAPHSADDATEHAC